MNTEAKTYQPFEFDGEAVAGEIARILNDVAKHAGSEERFKGSFEGPGVPEIIAYYNRNCTVTATITLSSNNPGRTWNPVEIPVLYPYHGVFVVGKGNGQFRRECRSKLMTWFPCLKRRPGLWFFHSIQDETVRDEITQDVKVGDEITAEFVFHNGMRIPCEYTKKQAKDADKTIGTPCLPNGLDDRSKKRLFLNKTLKDKFSEYIGARCHRKFIDSSNKKTYDEQDLETQRLFTYNVFLLETITASICNGWFDNSGSENPAYWTQEPCSKAKKKDNKDGAGTPTKVINGLVISSFIRKSILSPKKNQYNWLHPFSPENSVAAISSLTMLSRYGWVKTENMSAASRQNHPSFYRKICPVQTPESAKIGIILNLAVGAKVDLHGHIHESDSKTGLGYSASLIPFYHHTDSARAMLGAKNYVQALPVSGAEEPLVKTGMEGDIRNVLEPLEKLGLLESTPEFHAPGCNLIVAYMTYDGLNFNDAIVVSESAADKLASSERDELECSYDDPLVTKFEGDGQTLQFGKIKSSTKKGKHYRLELGDKLTGRHGNKGVVSAIIPDFLMPRLTTDDRLGELSGKPVDILLNPLGVISRMNVSQLLESHIGLLKMLGIAGLPEGTGKPFEKTDADVIQNLLLSINQGGEKIIDDRGQMAVHIRYFNPLNRGDHYFPVVVGIQYFVKLNHIPANKRNIRIRALENEIEAKDYDPVTWQAKKGRSVNGGQSLGAMEMWALEAYQADKLMEYFLTDAILPKPIDPNTVIASNDNVSQTFRAMQDWLFAMCIVIDKDNDGKYWLRCATDEDIINRGKELRCPEGNPRDSVVRALKGIYKCSAKKCNYQVDAEGTKITWTKKKANITVEDLLRGSNILFEAFDYEAQIVAKGEGKVMKLPVSPGQPSVSIIWKDEKRIKIDFEKGSGKSSYYAYYYSKEKVVRRTMVDILSMKLCCCEDESKHLECAITEATKFSESNQFGGLADPSVFRDSAYSWGYIKLQKPLHPAKFISEAVFGDDCTLNVLPVLPWMYRPSIDIEKGDPVPSKLTGLYENIIRASGKELETAFEQLLTFLKEKLSGKDGLMRSAAAGRRVDNSGRMVCIPDPTGRHAKWDECAFSINALKAMYPHDKVLQSINDKCINGMEITDHLRSKGYLVLVNRAPTLHRYNLKVLRPVAFSPYYSPGTHEDQINNVIIVNPLISQSMGLDWDGDEMSFFLVPNDCLQEAERLLPTHADNFLSVATKMPVLEFEQDLVLGTFLMGMETWSRDKFWETVFKHDRSKPHKEINPKVDPWDAAKCQQMLDNLVSRKKDSAVETIERWLKMAFSWMTVTGVTISYFDLLKCFVNKPICLNNAELKNMNTELDKCSAESLDEILKQDYEYKRELVFTDVKSHRDVISRRPGFDIAAMVRSKARGDKQIRQLILSRGYLDPGKTGFDVKGYNFFFTENLVDGMSDPERSFYAAMNGRSTMTAKKLSTQDAGALTNLMVAACRNWTVEAGDCGQEESISSPATCLYGARQRICQNCYGKMSDGTLPDEGYPIGIIAAQSIGERGTQLSMKGFHSGAQAVDVEALKKRLTTDVGFTEFSDKSTGLSKFIVWLDNFQVYKKIDRRHKELMWRVICESGTKGEQSIARAIEKACEGHVFASLASPKKQWNLIAKAIRKQTRETPDSPLAKTMLGFVSQSTVPVYANMQEKAYTTPFDDNDDEELNSDLPEEMTDEAPADLRGFQTIDPDDDIQEADELEDGEEINAPNVSDTAVRISTAESIIAIIVIQDTIEVRCEVELAPRAESSSRIAILAEAFAAWLAKNETGTLPDTSKSFTFKDQTEMLKAVTSEAPGQVRTLFDEKDSTASKDASRFVNRAVIYWDNRYLPVSSLFKKLKA